MDLFKEYNTVTRLKTDLSDSMFKHLLNDSLVCTYLRQIHDYSITTFKHSINVYTIVVAITQLEQQSKGDIYTIAKAALLHDIGKLQIPLDILHKPSSLTRSEFEIMKTHVYKGCVMAEELGADTPTLRGILDHHERVDGKGYPQHSRGSCISREGKIIAVADIYDALVSKREYKESVCTKSAIKEMEDIKALNRKAFNFLKQIVNK